MGQVTAALQLRLLGKPHVQVDGVLVSGFRTAKAEALLYYLTATGQAHSRELLADLLWGELPEATAKRNLTKALSHLRKQFAPFLVIEPEMISLQPAVDLWLDVAQFEAAVRQGLAEGDLDLLAQAAEGYRGDFLAGFHLKQALPFEEWLLGERERLRELMLQTLQRLVSEAINRGEHATGLAYALRMLALEPWHETAHRQLMLLLARTGRREAALAQFETCRHILAKELGVEPMAETRALYERLKAIGQSPAHPLPPPPNAFIGRETELQHIERHLADPACRMVTITGLGGIGKTRLALAAAHQANQASAMLFLNGVAFVSLASVTEAAAVPLALVNALGVSLTGTTPPRQALLSFLRNREMLLVLDNFEHVTAAVDFLLELLPSCPAVKLLITSRAPLNLATEWRLDLEGLPVPPAAESEVAALQNYAAVALFVRSASQVNLQFRLSAENAVAVGRLCRLVAGMPLALQLAATWLRAMPVTAILAALERDLDILATEMHDIPPRQRSMRAVFESAWLLLSADEQRTVETLAVCRGGFTPEAADKIAGANLFLLRRVIDRAMIYQQGEFRYGMHPLIQQFAQEQLAKDERQATAAADHGRYYLSWLADQEPALHGQTPQTTISLIKVELDNLQQAWRWAGQTRQIAQMQHSLAGLTTFYELVGLLQEGEQLIEETLAQLGPASGPDEELLLCQLLIAKGQFVCAQGRYEPADETLAAALKLARRLRHAESLADIQDLRGRILTDTGVYAGAKQQYWHALNSYRQLANERKTAKTLTDLGWTHILDDEVEAALPLLQEALALERQAGHKRGVAYVLGNIAVAYSIKGDPQQALVHQREVLAAYEELGELLNLERAENNMGMTMLAIGRYEAALPHMQRAVDLARQLEVRPGLANALDSLGTAYLACGDYAKAKTCLDEALDLALEIGYMYMNYSVRAVLVRLFNRTGDLTQAQEQLQQLRMLAETVENTTYVARALLEQAQLTYLQGELPEATALAAQAIDLLRQNSAPLELPFFLLQQADYLRELQRPAEALPLVQEALAGAQQLQHKPLQLRAAALAAGLSGQLDQTDAARAYAETARLLLPQLEPYPDTLEGVLHLGRFQLAQGNGEAAARLLAFVTTHPATAYGVCRQAETLLAEIAAHSKVEPLDWPRLVSYLTGNEIADQEI